MRPPLRPPLEQCDAQLLRSVAPCYMLPACTCTYTLTWPCAQAWWTPAWQLGVVAAAGLMLFLMLRGRQQSIGGMPPVLKAV